MNLRFILCLLPLFLFAQGDGWRKLDEVRFDPDVYSDGDSFGARRNTVKYIFRLYFVDAPETDTRFFDRVGEQAAYFGITSDQALQGGKTVSVWLRELLQKEDITVYTRYADAGGTSDRKRYFAMVKVGNRWLSELLVLEGFARIHGLRVTLPDGETATDFQETLRKHERKAKRENKGLWGVASGKGELAAGSSAKVTLKVPTPIFGATPPHALVGTLPAGWEISVGKATRPGFRSVTFTSASGNEFTGEIQESQMPR